MSAGSSPESPQVNSSVTTNPGDAEHGSNVLSPVPGAFPDVRLLPDGRVAWRIPLESLPGDLEWLSTRQSQQGSPHRPWWFRSEDLPLAEAQCMVPVGPLLELLAELTIRQAHCIRDDVDDAVFAYGYAAQMLSALLGETTTGEGS